MKIFVCIKQVPDTETKIKIAGDGKSIDSTGFKWVMNPYDEYAVEEAVKTRDANPGSQVWAITMGPKRRASDTLRTALAMGADEAILVDGPENLEPLATAAALAQAIKLEGDIKLIFAGKLSIDDNASSVPQMIAEFLGIPHATVVSKFSMNPEFALIERDTEGGSKEIIQLALPAMIAANKGLNMPRYASLPGIMKAKKKIIKEIEISTLGLALSEKTKVLSLSLPAEKAPAKMIAGDSQSQVQQLAQLLRNEAKVL